MGQDKTETGKPDFWKEAKRFVILLLEALLILASLSGILAAILTLRNRLRRRRYEANGQYEKIKHQMKKVFLIGKFYRLALEDGETLEAFERRTKGRLDTPENSFSEIRGRFERIRFGAGLITDSDIGGMERYTAALERQYLQGCGWLKRFFYYMR